MKKNVGLRPEYSRVNKNARTFDSRKLGYTALGGTSVYTPPKRDRAIDNLFRDFEENKVIRLNNSL